MESDSERYERQRLEDAARHERERKEAAERHDDPGVFTAFVGTD